MLDPRIVNPSGSHAQASDLSSDEVDQVVAVLEAIKAWRESEERLSVESRSYMRLNETDMKALRFIIAAKNSSVLVTAGMLAEHLQISTASITKMLDRLVKAEHVTRTQHPRDRRAVVISITEATHRDARATIGRRHARRFDVAAELSPAEREVVIRFLRNLAALEDEVAHELDAQADGGQSRHAPAAKPAPAAAAKQARKPATPARTADDDGDATAQHPASAQPNGAAPV